MFNRIVRINRPRVNTTTAITGITAGPTAANDIVGTKDFAFVCLQVYICVYCIRGVILGGREGARYGRFWGRIWFGSSVFKSRRTCLIYGKRWIHVIVTIDV